MSQSGRSLSTKDLNAAFRNRQFEPFYQPQADIHTGEIVRFEAVARWRHPRLGLLTPNLFLDHIRVHDCFYKFSLAILERAIEDCAKWRRGRGNIKAGVSVNVSGHDVTQPKFANKLKAMLAKHKLPASQLTLEIPELDLIGRNRQDVTVGLLALKTLGCGVAMEARGPVFEADEESNLPLTQLKIGGAAVMRFASAFQDNRVGVVHRRLAWARAQGLDTVAIGAETASALRALTVLGFDFVQCDYLASAQDYKSVRPIGRQTFLDKIEHAANGLECARQGRAYKEKVIQLEEKAQKKAQTKGDAEDQPYSAPRRFGNQSLALTSVDMDDEVPAAQTRRKARKAKATKAGRPRKAAIQAKAQNS